MQEKGNKGSVVKNTYLGGAISENLRLPSLRAIQQRWTEHAAYA
jgi:hypothetical protein